MVEPVSDLAAMLASLDPQLVADLPYCFVEVTPDQAPLLLNQAVGTFREAEGVTAIVPSSLAQELDISAPEFAQITLQVHSDLEGVGLTAAVSSALANEGIACNVVAAFHHDHVFVPWDLRELALAVLQQLSADARR